MQEGSCSRPADEASSALKHAPPRPAGAPALQTPALWEDLARVLARLDEALLSCRVEGLEGKSSWNMRHLEQTWAELLPSLTADVVSPEQRCERSAFF